MREVDLKQKTKSLEKAEKAMLNIMEDLEVERDNLAKAKAKDDAILQNIGEGLVVTNLKGVVERMNEVALKMIEAEPSEIIGRLWSEDVKTQDEEGKSIPKKNLPLLKALKKGHTVFEKRFYYVKKSGIAFPVAITASPILLNDRTIGGILIFRDITHEKEVDQAKTEFVSFASHQLRTPLATINWYTEMILDGDAGKLKPQQKEYLKEVYASCQRMVKLVNDILNVSRLELGTFTIDPQETQLKDLAEESLKELESKIHEKKTRILKKYAPHLPTINVDPKLTHMIFLNLLSNAIKYTPEKGKVQLSIERKDPYLLIRVEDNGYGIPKAQQSKMFTKLFRADNVKAMDIEGTGFGLYIIKTVVEKSGGKIWFESKENKGSTFFVQLPLKGMSAKQGTKTLAY